MPKNSIFRSIRVHMAANRVAILPRSTSNHPAIFAPAATPTALEIMHPTANPGTDEAVKTGITVSASDALNCIFANESGANISVATVYSAAIIPPCTRGMSLFLLFICDSLRILIIFSGKTGQGQEVATDLEYNNRQLLSVIIIQFITFWNILNSTLLIFYSRPNYLSHFGIHYCCQCQYF